MSSSSGRKSLQFRPASAHMDPTSTGVCRHTHTGLKCQESCICWHRILEFYLRRTIFLHSTLSIFTSILPAWSWGTRGLQISLKTQWQAINLETFIQRTTDIANPNSIGFSLFNSRSEEARHKCLSNMSPAHGAVGYMFKCFCLPVVSTNDPSKTKLPFRIEAHHSDFSKLRWTKDKSCCLFLTVAYLRSCPMGMPPSRIMGVMSSAR